MAVMLSGDLDFDKTIQMVDRTFGLMKEKKLIKPTLPKENPINEIRRLSITDSNNESVYIGFRYSGANSKEEKYVTLIDLLLKNGKAGLFDTALKTNSFVQDAKSYIIKNKDYGIHLLDGYPRRGQSLEEVEALLVKEIEKIKNGNFDEWLLEAVINELKKRDSDELSSLRLGGTIYTSFIHEQSWGERLSYVDELAKITKNELVNFANEFYKKNYVVLYKHYGDSKQLANVKKPKIKTLEDNSSKRSVFAKELDKIAVSKIQPKFLDFSKRHFIQQA